MAAPGTKILSKGQFCLNLDMSGTFFVLGQCTVFDSCFFEQNVNTQYILVMIQGGVPPNGSVPHSDSRGLVYIKNQYRAPVLRYDDRSRLYRSLDSTCRPCVARIDNTTTAAARWRLQERQKRSARNRKSSLSTLYIMASDSEDSGSDSECSEGARVARERLGPKTQKDYSGYIKQLTRFVLHQDRVGTYRDCVIGDQVIMPVPLKVGKAFMSNLRGKLVSWPMDSRPVDQRTYVRHYSRSHINNACLAIKNTFKLSGVPLPAADEAYYSNFSQAYALQIAAEKGTGAYPSVEGSVALGSSDIMKVIEAACRYVPEGKGRAQSAVQRLWLFILMALASMGRGERVSRVQFQCIRAFCDSLTVQIPTSKSDILGLMSYAKMCYANARNPMCCLATALGVEFLSRDPNGGFQFLFGEQGESGSYIVKQMQGALRLIIDKIGADSLGTTSDRLTTHFLKKTGMRLLRDFGAGIVESDSRELRADHKVGPYNQRSEQDGVVGRVLAFLKPGTTDFELSPPHFHSDIVRAIPWARIVPGYVNYTVETQQAVHLAVASAIANFDFLHKNLSRSHCFHGCPLVTSERMWIGILAPYLSGGKSSFKSCLAATGISLISGMAIDVHHLRLGGAQSGQGALSSQDVQEITELREAIVQLKTIITGSISSGTLPLPQQNPSSAASWSRIFPRLWIESSFRFPVGVKVQDAWMRWHCGEHPLRSVTSKMLPEGEDRQRQCTLRRKFQGVFEIIQGKTSCTVVDLDVHHAWDVCWRCTVERFTIPLPCTWVISTAYDFFLKFPDKVQLARQATPCESADVAVAAAARAALVAEETRAFALATQTVPLVRNNPASSPEMSAANLDLPVLGDDAALIIAQNIIAQNIVAVAGPAALHPPPLLQVLPAAAQLRRRVQPAPASAAPSALSLLQQPPVGTALHAFWAAPTNLWMLGTVMYTTVMYITHREEFTCYLYICVHIVLIVCHGDVHHNVGRLCCY